MFTGSHRIGVLLLLLLLLIPLSPGSAQGAYLPYQPPDAPAETTSWGSTLVYILSLLATFAAVIGCAYLASRFLGQKMGNLSAGRFGKIMTVMPLGSNRAVYVVEVAGKYLVLGVTDHTITLLQEIVDTAEIEKLRRQPEGDSGQEKFDHIFQKHLASLQQLSQKFPAVFDSERKSKQDDGHEKR